MKRLINDKIEPTLFEKDSEELFDKINELISELLYYLRLVSEAKAKKLKRYLSYLSLKVTT